jgi:hypothetical protein
MDLDNIEAEHQPGPESFRRLMVWVRWFRPTPERDGEGNYFLRTPRISVLGFTGPRMFRRD